MTRSRLIYLALLIAAFIFSQALYDSISLFTLAVVLLIPLISLLCLLVSLLLVKIEPEAVPDHEKRLHPFALRVVIKSKTPVMLPMMRFNFRVSSPAGDAAVPGYSVAHYRAFGKTDLELPMNFKVRGLYKVGVQSVVFYDFLRLFSIKRKLSGTGVVAVGPRDLQLELPLQTSRQEQENTVTAGGRETKNGGDMAGIREFNEYDTLRQVHWKLSSRLSKMIVKTYWENSSDNIMVLADLFPYQEQSLLDRRLTDCVVEVALYITKLLAEKNVRSTLGYANYENMLHQQSISDAAERAQVIGDFAMTPMMEAGTLEQSLSRMDFSALQGGALYIVTSMPPEDLEKCEASYLRGLNCDVQYLVIRPLPEAERGKNMKVIPLMDLEEGGTV